MAVVVLKFTNADASPNTVETAIKASDVKNIVAWYDSHHSGDNYRVFVDGDERTVA